MGRARDWLSKLVDMDHPAVTPRSDVVMRGLLFFEEYPYRFLVTIATFCLLLLLRYTVALHPYSGKYPLPRPTQTTPTLSLCHFAALRGKMVGFMCGQ